MFFTSGSKKHGIYNVFWPAPSTNTGIYGGVHHVTKCGFGIRKKKTVNYNVLSLLLGCVGGVAGGWGRIPA